MKLTSFNVAVVEGDTHLSKWIMEHGRLDIAEGFLSLFRRFIPDGGTVVDIGACLGDHTATYSKFVGPRGEVHAFEPNPVALECLEHNMKPYRNVIVHGEALGAFNGEVSIKTNDNLGMAQVIEGAGIKLRTLDSKTSGWARLDFIKIDAEGYELDILIGAIQTITRFRPVMLIEVNRGILTKQGRSPDDVFRKLKNLGYSCLPAEKHLRLDMEQVDVLCLPR